MGAKKTKIGMLVAGFALALFGLALSQFFEQIIFYRFERELPLKPGSQSFKQWQITPIPITMSVYFWNWTNPHQIGKENYKPSFVEMGPYVFREVHEKVNVTWNPNGTITYRTIKRWYFDKDKTKGSLEDEITSVNAVAASIAYIGRSWNRFFLYPVSVALVTSGQKLWWTKNVSQLLFEGFDNSIQSLSSYIPGFPAPDKFGWFYKRNGTISSDTFNIGTGANSLDELGELKFWNFKNQTTHYPKCSNLTGYNGEFWPPKRTKKDFLNMFTTDMCRKVVYYFEEESEYRGLKTLIYAGTKETVDNGTVVEENKCYCDPDHCPPSGVFDVSKCQFGAPVFISYPHFYNADPYYEQSVKGMNPSREKHRFYIALEPRTGIQVDVAARMQVNIFLKKNSALSMYRKVEDVFIPVFWLENRASLSDQYTIGIKIMLKIVEFGPFIYYGMCVLGCLIIIAVILLHCLTSTFFAKKIRDSDNGGSKKGRLSKSEEIPISDGRTNMKEMEYTFAEIKL